jgi:predicted MFS family arabinose efflux permease
MQKRIDMNEENSLRAGFHPAKETSAPVPGYAWVILLVAFLASVAAPLAQFKVPPLLPVLMDAFRLSLSQAGMLMSVFAFTGLILALPAGVVTHKLGPKGTGLIAVGCLVVGSAWGALSGSTGWLLASRVVEGVGMGLIAVAAPASIALWFPREKQGTPMGIWATWVPMGSVIMYNLAPALQALAGWRAVWWVGGGFALLAFILYWLLMRLPPSTAGERPPGQAEAPPQLGRALANRSIWLLGLQFGCMNLVFIALSTFFPTFLSEVRGYSIAQAAFIASLPTLMILGSAPLAGWLSDRIGSRRLVFAIPYLVIAAMMTLPFKLSGPALYIFMILLGVVIGAIPTATFAAAPEIMGRPQLAGLGLAVVALGQNLGMVIGPILLGSLVENIGWAPAGYWLIPICLLGFVAGWLVRVR